MNTDTIETVGVTEFSHINLNQIDPSYQAIDEGFYTLQVNKITPKNITPGKGKNAGKELLVLDASYTVVGDDQYSGRKFWKSFWTNNARDLRELRQQQDATGNVQKDGQLMEDYARTFEGFNPPLEFRIFIAKERAWNAGPDDAPVNVLKFNQAQPANS